MCYIIQNGETDSEQETEDMGDMRPEKNTDEMIRIGREVEKVDEGLRVILTTSGSLNSTEVQIDR